MTKHKETEREREAATTLRRKIGETKPEVWRQTDHIVHMFLTKGTASHLLIELCVDDLDRLDLHVPGFSHGAQVTRSHCNGT